MHSKAVVNQVVDPAHVLRLPDRQAGRIDAPLQLVGAFKLLAGPEFNDRQPKAQPALRHRLAWMHRDPAKRIIVAPTVARTVLGPMQQSHMLPPIRKFGRVVEHEDCASDRQSFSSSTEMPTQDIGSVTRSVSKMP